MKIVKNRIRIYFYIGSVFSIIILAVLLYFNFTKALNSEYERKIEQLSSGITREKKRFLKNAVDRTIQMIEIERNRAQKEGKKRGLSFDQVNKRAIKEIKYRIHQMRLIDNGYVWVNRIVNYNGGDKYAVREIHPNLLKTEGMWLSTNMTDNNGNKPYLTELNGMKKEGELYFEYHFKKMNSDKTAHKMSYAKLYKPYNWVVATGVYLDDVDKLIQRETKLMKESNKSQQLYSLIVIMLAIMLSSFVLILFERLISQLIRSYEQDINEYTNSLIEEKEKTEQALHEVKTLSGLLPICSNCKKIRDDKGYWNYLESYIEKHSDAFFSHSICPACAEKLYPEQYKQIKKKK